MRGRILTATHEAAHLTAGYILGTLNAGDLCHIPPSGNAGSGASAHVLSTRTIRDAVKTREGAEAAIVGLLAGSAALLELGIDAGGGAADELLAAKIAVAFAEDDRDGALELMEHCEERTRRLVASSRFQTMLVAMMGALDAVPAMSGRRAAELLASWDPEPITRRRPSKEEWRKPGGRYRIKAWSKRPGPFRRVYVGTRPIPMGFRERR